MKKLFIISCLALVQFGFAQDPKKTIDLESAQITNSTCLSLLDNTAAVVTSNPDCKDFSVNTENLSAISFDGSLNKGKLSGLEYYGLGNSTAEFKQLTMEKLLRPNFSGVLNKNDSTATFAVGFNVNVLTVFAVRKEKMVEAFNKMTASTKELNKIADGIMKEKYPNLDRFNPAQAAEFNEKYQQVMDSIPTKVSDEFAEILKRPLLTFDVAVANSILYPDNKYKNSQPDRLGVWGTLTACKKFNRKDTYLNAYVFTRYLEDRSVYNAANQDYSDQMKYFDFGGKLQLDANNLSFAYEYIKRNGAGKDYRSVGMIQYKVNDDVYLTGGFGKNFESDSDKDLVTLFGIRWGINKKDEKEAAKGN